ncbi:hypothetical protein P7C73_g5326, partial [Tremellales sp. Uapishka_1]
MAPSMEILPVEEVDIPELCRLELEARDHNPNWRFPEQTSWTKEAKLEFKIRGFRYIYSRSTSVYLKCCIRNEIAGFVGWDDPDYLIKRVPDQTHTREEVMKGADKTFWNTMREAHQAAEAEAPAKYWYLSNLVTARSHQGQGVGSALLEWGVRRADAANLPIFCLSSPQVRGFLFSTCGLVSVVGTRDTYSTPVVALK